MIPPHPSATVKREDDARRSRERPLVEGGINQLQHFRRIFSRFDTLDRSYLVLRPLRLCAHLVTLKRQQNLIRHAG